jgi:PAS domain S-box-containing protein
MNLEDPVPDDADSHCFDAEEYTDSYSRSPEPLTSNREPFPIEASSLDFLLGLSEHLQGTGDIREIAQYVLSYLVRAVNAAFGDIKIIAGTGEQRRATPIISQISSQFIATSSEPTIANLQAILNQDIPDAQGLLWQVVVTGEPLLVEADTNHLAAVPAPHYPSIGQLSIFPISFKNKTVVGVLTLGSPYQTITPNSPQYKIVMAACRMVGAAIERQQTEDALRESERRYATLADIAPVGIFRTDCAGQCVYANDRWCRFAGISVPEALGTGWIKALHPDDREQVFAEWQQAVQTRQPFSLEYRFLKPDGEVVWVFGQSDAELNEDGKVIGYVGTITNISKRKQAEAALKQSERLYRTLVENFPNGAVVLFDHDLRYTIADGAGLQKIGLSKQMLEGKTIWQVFPDDFCKTVEPHYRQALAGEGSAFEATYADRTFFVETLPVRNECGEIFAGILVAQDITERKKVEEFLQQANEELGVRVEQQTTELKDTIEQLQQEIGQRQRTQAALQDSEAKLRAIIDNSSDIIFIKDLQGRYLLLNPAGVKLFDRPIQELLGKRDQDLLPSTIAEKLWLDDQRVMASGRTQSFEDTIATPHGQYTFLVNKAPYYSPNQELLGVIGISRDITDRKQAENQLRLLESVVVNANDAVVITEATSTENLDPRIVYANAAFTRLTGYSLEEVVGKTPRILQGEKTDRATLDRIRAALQTWQPILVELINYRKDGSEFWVELSIVPVADKANRHTHWVAIQRDITQRKQLEVELHRTLDKEKELSDLKSRFVSMTSHEFRTPLSTILSASELLEYYSHHWTEAEKLEQLHLIQSSVHHMTQLLEDILLIGKAEAGQLQSQPETTDLNHFCVSLITEMQLGLGCHHTLVFSCPPGTVEAYIDKKLLRQILSNLLSNAIKYSTPGSQVSCTLVADSTAAIVQVQDKGMGIPPEDLPRVFNSFHRAKNVGTIPGTGLGLAIVKRCLDLLGGQITMQSELGIGTTFTIRLPLTCATTDE